MSLKSAVYRNGGTTLLLTGGGGRCAPGALTRAGFEFAFPDLDKALRDLLAPGS